MTPDVTPWPRPEWSPLPYDGCVGVEGRVLVRAEHFSVAQLRFAERATIHEHPGESDAIVVILEGEGFTSVGDETTAVHAGEQVLWPKGVKHRLWTEAATMQTLMIEDHPPAA